MNPIKSKRRGNRLCNNYQEDGELENESFRGKDYVAPPACNMFEISVRAMGKQYLQTRRSRPFQNSLIVHLQRLLGRVCCLQL